MAKRPKIPAKRVDTSNQDMGFGGGGGTDGDSYGGADVIQGEGRYPEDHGVDEPAPLTEIPGQINPPQGGTKEPPQSGTKAPSDSEDPPKDDSKPPAVGIPTRKFPGKKLLP